MSIPSAYRNKAGEWVYPQCYYRNEHRISKKELLAQINSHPLIQEAIRLEPSVGKLIQEAASQRCVYGYDLIHVFYERYKPALSRYVGWDASKKELRTSEHYDAVYEAIYDLLPDDEDGLYPDGIMPDGKFSPQQQERYGREYP